MEPPLINVIQGIDFSCLVMVCSTTFVLIRLLGDMLLVIVNNSFLFYQDCTVWTYSIDNWCRHGSTYSWYWRLIMELGTTVQSGYSRHRENEQKYICYEASFKGHCILHKKVRINFTTNACSVVLWLPMFALRMGYLPSIMSRYQVLFLRFYQDHDVVEVHKHAKKQTRPIYSKYMYFAVLI